jgi:RNA polymerase sigma-70 factor (ECF subfamily)
MSVNLQELKDEELYMMLSGDKRKARIAFDELYNRYSDRIFTYCRKYIQNDSVAEDVFQEVFIRLHTSSQKNVVIKNIGGFLITVARNLCHNEVNRKNYNFSDLK